MKRTLLALAAALCSAGVSAETLIWRFDFPDNANNAFTWGLLGDERGPFTGEVVSTKLVITDYTTVGATDAADFYFTFDVPTLGATTHIGLTGKGLGWSGNGPFSYSVTTDLYNGEIRAGRFGTQIDGGGHFAGGGYLELTIEGSLPDELFADSFDYGEE